MPPKLTRSSTAPVRRRREFEAPRWLEGFQWKRTVTGTSLRISIGARAAAGGQLGTEAGCRRQPLEPFNPGGRIGRMRA